MSHELYTIIVSGKKLVFTKDQIKSDPGNYFATYFFGDFAEGSRGARELIVQKDIHLFKLIQAHLRGYRILPLADNAIPSYMTREVALVNLFLEAQYYGLQHLEETLRLHKSNIGDLAAGPQVTPPKRYKFAKFDREWNINDTTPEGYQMMLSRLTTTPGKILATNKNLIAQCPGFTQVICWMDKPGDINCIYALLESNPT